MKDLKNHKFVSSAMGDIYCQCCGKVTKQGDHKSLFKAGTER